MKISVVVGAVLLAALAVPVVAFMVIPAAVSKTVHEALPTTATTASAGTWSSADSIPVGLACS